MIIKAISYYAKWTKQALSSRLTSQGSREEHQLSWSLNFASSAKFRDMVSNPMRSHVIIHFPFMS